MSRQTGLTTKQMLESVGGSIYIWPYENSIDYAIRLASHIGREDLQIFSACDLKRPANFQGRYIYGITIDHDCDLSILEMKTVSDVILPRIREVKP